MAKSKWMPGMKTGFRGDDALPASERETADTSRTDSNVPSHKIAQSLPILREFDPSPGKRRGLETALEHLGLAHNSLGEAAARILTLAEQLLEHAKRMEVAGVDPAEIRGVSQIAANLMVSCSFHDIAGQRLKIVQEEISTTDARVVRLLELWKTSCQADETTTSLNRERRDPLLSGPSLAGDGVSQAHADFHFSDTSKAKRKSSS